MAVLYTLGIHFYGLFLKLAAIFHPKAKSWVKGRSKWRSNLPLVPADRPVYWFHCASLGEFDQGLPVMNLLREQQPTAFLLVTFFSPSGMEHYHKRQHPADFVCYLPLDTPRNARDFVQHFQPKYAIFVKYEFWIHFILAAKKHGSQLISISAIFRPDHRFFKPWGSFFRKALVCFDQFFVQTNESRTLLQSIGIQNAQVVGDTRFDRVIENKNNVRFDAVLDAFTGKQKAFVVGSSWSPDEALLEPFLTQQRVPTILAPHDISAAHLTEIEKRFSSRCIRYSNWTPKSEAHILLIDSIGKLANAYSYGSIAYVGGGFSGNLHNILEPAVFGLPVIFGPKHRRFPEAAQFIQEGIGFSVERSDQLEQTVAFIEKQRTDLAVKTASFVERQAGASQKILRWMESVEQK